MNQIQQIKDKYGQQAEEIISSGLNLRNKGKKYHCPNTSGHRNGDRNPSMSWDPNANQFYCFACGHKIDLYGYYREHLNYSHQEIIRDLLGEEDYSKTEIQTNRNKFTDRIKSVKDINQECIDYIKLRGITEETIKYFNLKTYNNLIAFPYHRYETPIGYKTRKPVKDPGKNKMMSIAGSKPLLFNLQNVDLENRELIICEGEFDCMIIHQCGFENVVSVGAGGNSFKKLVEQSKDYLNQFDVLIIVSDLDETGENMDAFFSEEFGDKAKLIDKKLYTRNDINEEYVINGKSKVIELIESARFKIEGRWDLDKEPYTGVTPKSGKYVPTGLPSIDYGINDLAPGFTTLITGRTNGGKSTLVRQIIANAIETNNKVYIMNGEENRNNIINKIYQCVIGNSEKDYDLIKVNKRFKKEPKPNVSEKLQEWHKGKLVLFNKGDSRLKTIDELTKMLEFEVKVNNFNLVVIDNLMSILSYNAAEKNEMQSDFMQRLCDLAKTYNTHIILVLHPNKSYRKGSEMDVEHISGASELYNKADNVISVIREYDEDVLALGIDGKVAVIKNRDFEDLPTVDIYYDKETKLLLEIDEMTNEVLGYNFNWNRDELEGFQLAVDKDCPF